VRSLPEGECAARWGGLGGWCMRRSASLSLGFTAPLARPLAHLSAWAGGHAGLAASIFYAGDDSAFRVWRILGGGKIRQTLCVLNLAKIF